MCTTANMFILSVKHGVVLREFHHGDRFLIEHDGETIANTLPNDVDSTYGSTGLGKKMVEWVRRNLRQLKYVHDFATKMIEIKFVDDKGNALHALYPASKSFEEFLDYVEANDIDDIFDFRVSRIMRDEEALKKTVKALRDEFVKAKAEETN